jgi:hypothetical protein
MAHADSFTCHGNLQDAGQAARGRYDLQLTLYSAQNGGSVLAGPVTRQWRLCRARCALAGRAG